MILIETYRSDGSTAMHTQSCDGVQFEGCTLAKLNKPPKMPIIERFVIHLAGGSKKWKSRPGVYLTITFGGSLMM